MNNSEIKVQGGMKLKEIVDEVMEKVHLDDIIRIDGIVKSVYKYYPYFVMVKDYKNGWNECYSYMDVLQSLLQIY